MPSNAQILATTIANALNRLHGLSARPDLSNVTNDTFATKAAAAGVGGAVGAALTALAALTPAADRIPYFTGASAASQITTTSFGRSLLGLADGAALGALTEISTIPVFCIDPTLAPYNAKLDAFACGDAVTTQTSTAGDTVSTVQRTFISTDIGKSLWLGTSDTERTITNVVDGKAIISPAYGSNTTGLQLLQGTDDTAALQAAQDYASNNPITGVTGPSSAQHQIYVRDGLPMGARVQGPSGRGAIVSNSVASYDGGKKSALVMRRRTEFGGSGAGFASLALHLKPGSKGHVIGNENPEAITDYADFITLSNFTVYCYADTWNPLALDGVKISVAGDGYAKKDPFLRLSSVYVYNAGRDGVSLTGRGEALVWDVAGLYCNRNGFRNQGLDDSRFYHVVAAGNDKAGIVSYGGGPVWFIGGKSFYNGAGGGDVDEDCCNVLIDTDNPYTGLVSFLGFEAQESRGSSFIIKARANLQGCLALDPGRSTLGGGSLPSDIAGYKLKTVHANNVVLEGCKVGATLTNFSDAPGNLGNAKWALYVDEFTAGVGGPAKCRGDIYYDEHVVITTTALGNNPVATQDGSATVTITSTAHGLATDRAVNITGLTDTGGIAAANLNGVHKITVINANSYSFTAAAAATSTVAAGGGAGGSVDWIIAGVSFAASGGAKGGTGTSNGKNTSLKVNGTACT